MPRSLQRYLPLFLALGGLGVGLWYLRVRPAQMNGRAFTLSATELDGTALSTPSFQGKPWVINLWRPG